MQADHGRVLGVDGLVRRADFEGGRGFVGSASGRWASQSKPSSLSVVAGLDLDEADVEPRVAVAGEGQRAGDVDDADRARPI